MAVSCGLPILVRWCKSVLALICCNSSYLQGTALDRRNRQRCDSHLRDLIGVLYAVSPSVMDDPHFLERSVLLEGVGKSTSPRDLLVLPDFEAQEAVLVRDAEFGDRVGLLVLRDTSDYAIALAAVAPSGSYCNCFPVSIGTYLFLILSY